MAYPGANPPDGSWSTGLYDCCDDVGSCCLTYFCPCVAFGRIASIVSRGKRCKLPETTNGLILRPVKSIDFGLPISALNDLVWNLDAWWPAGTNKRMDSACCLGGTLYMLLTLLTVSPGLYACCYRSDLRAQYGLNEKPCADCCVHFFCHGCALCQEYRELKTRGFDMSIGWHANMERMGNGAATVAPQMHPGMTR